METRRELVRRLSALFPEGRFIYGGYREKPKVPYGNYSMEKVRLYKTDDKVSVRFEWYVIRIVTEVKDFDLEDQVTAIFDDMELTWEWYDEHEATGTKAGMGNEKVYAIEYLVEVPRYV